ncbi:hypothetical protein J2Z48_003207 [Croceifilum oryzae]|uniref:Uncharacterized protein n=1 Tax=Croceifilum oryzae TaxID=1553429 RepID=A0AAJ1TLZ1_9BACL|nr:hypothetical protein [Croceifilum oryzae]MDQ0418982.1 hypothetical protein [Croceifilum oryzae]
MSVSLFLKARLILFRLDEKFDIDYDGYSGMKTTFKTGDTLISCRVIHGDPETPIEREKEYCVTIDLAYGHLYKDLIHEGCKFTLVFSSIEFGEGEILEILD